MAIPFLAVGLGLLGITTGIIGINTVENEIHDYRRRDLGQTYGSFAAHDVAPYGSYAGHPHANPRKDVQDLPPTEWGPSTTPPPSFFNAEHWNLMISESKRDTSQAGLSRVEAPTLLQMNMSALSKEALQKFFPAGAKGVQVEVDFTKPARPKREEGAEAEVREAKIRLGDSVFDGEWKVHPSKNDGLIHGHLTFQPSDLAFPLEAAFAIVNQTAASPEMKDGFNKMLTTIQNLVSRPDFVEIAEVEAMQAIEAASKFLDGVKDEGEGEFEGTHGWKWNA